jgi:hypothetical protein
LECGDLSPLWQKIYWPHPGTLPPLSKERAIAIMRFVDIPAASRLVRQQIDS